MQQRNLFSIFILCLLFLHSCGTTKEKILAKTDSDNIVFSESYLNNLRWNLPLPEAGSNGSEIEWKSSDKEYISDNGTLNKLSERGKKQKKVNLTAFITNGEARVKKNFKFTIAFEEPKYDGYLFAYFEGSGERNLQEQLRFGVSANATDWFALNDNNPIIPSSEISKTGGIRDPHILRGEDEKSFFMVATDMFTMKDGWESNPGIILMKSDNLIEWQHSVIDFADVYPEKFGNVQWVWAPQVIFDPEADKYLVYFTIRYKNEHNLDFYCAHANDDFSGFINEPELMFRAEYGAIDGDILYKDGIYHFFFKGNTKDEHGHEYKNGIQKAVSTSLKGPWVEDYKYYDYYSAKKIPVEGSSVFKLNGEDRYYLMYDIYMNQRYEYQESCDLFEFTEQPKSFTKNFNPRHGSIISITTEEALRLNDKWGGVPKTIIN